MSRLLSYIKHGFQEAANLDNRSASRFHSERKQEMGLNEKKIRLADWLVKNIKIAA